jgi:4-aminobutyrate aminotransferase-like enzyme
VDGNTYLDGAASFGALSVGHAHHAVTRAVAKQASQLIHGMGDVHPSHVKVELLETIAKYVPISNPKIILGQSGAEAVESALKTALLATGKAGVLAFDGGYHGLTYGTLEPTSRAMFRKPFETQRGRFAKHIPYASSLDVVDRELFGGGFGAVIVEPIQGRGGIVVPPDGWLSALQEKCHKHAAVLIVDEIYTGWGRTGKLFASEWEGSDFQPDLLCIGKAMGGGMPISACVGSSQLIDKAWPLSAGEALHTSTFLGHPVACAAAIAAIETIVLGDLAVRASSSGESLKLGLQNLAKLHPERIIDVRGRGLMLGMQLHSAELARSLMLAMLRAGLILLLAGDKGDVVEITPPLIISERQINWCLKQLGKYFA